jgi:hypothetical protein
MTQQDDLDLALARDPDRSTGADTSWPPRRQRGPLVAAAVVIACLSAGIWYWWSRDDRQEPRQRDAVARTGTDEVVGDETPRLGEGEVIDLPPLDELDPVLRGMLATLSARPELARLLATDNLLRRFVTAVDGIGRGASPARHITVLRPGVPFSVDGPNLQSPVAPDAFARYGGLVATVADLDPADLSRLYASLRPRLDEAYAELGGPPEPFDAAMERAIVHLLAVDPDLAGGDVRPSAAGVTYVWANEATERLSPAQKHLLRLGPAGARQVQRSLRALAVALGIPAARLADLTRGADQASP